MEVIPIVGRMMKSNGLFFSANSKMCSWKNSVIFLRESARKEAIMAMNNDDVINLK